MKNKTNDNFLRWKTLNIFKAILNSQSKFLKIMGTGKTSAELIQQGRLKHFRDNVLILKIKSLVKKH